MRAAARDIHHAARPAAGHRGPGVRLPALPVARSPHPRFEGEQVELAVQDIEQLFGVAVQVSADVKSRPDARDLEHRPGLRVLVAHLERHGRRDPLALGRAQHETIRHEPDNPTAAARVKPQRATRTSSASKGLPRARQSARSRRDIRPDRRRRPRAARRADHPCPRRPIAIRPGRLPGRQPAWQRRRAGPGRYRRARPQIHRYYPAPVRLRRGQGSAKARILARRPRTRPITGCDPGSGQVSTYRLIRACDGYAACAASIARNSQIGVVLSLSGIEPVAVAEGSFCAMTAMTGDRQCAHVRRLGVHLRSPDQRRRAVTSQCRGAPGRPGAGTGKDQRP